MLRRTALLVVLLLVGSARAADPESEPPEEKNETEPAVLEDALREEVTVSANAEGTTLGTIGASATVVHADRAADAPASLTELVQAVPGVSENGQGGLFQVVSIRGVSRQRVSSLFSGGRLSSERRAGVAASFVDPLLMGAVEVLRGPATSFYGSGAVGGVIHVFPRRFVGTTLDTGYDSDGDETYQVAGFGRGGWSAGVAHRQKQDSEAAAGSRLNTQFQQVSAVVQRDWRRGERSYEVVGLGAYADDIGKDNVDFPDTVTSYPRERHLFVKFGARSERGWHLQGFGHTQDLITEVDEVVDASFSRVTNASTDFGARWDQQRSFEGLEMKFGAETYSRRGVDSEESRHNTDPLDPCTTSVCRALDNGSLDEAGAYASLLWSTGPVEWEGGGRYSWTRLDNRFDARRTLSNGSGHLGLTWTATRRLHVNGSASSGVRFPSLTELFFSGTTPRGSVDGNPDLDAERSLNVELSLSWLGQRLFVDGVYFHNRIDDYIERIEPDPILEPDRLTFVNLTSGTIEGVELHGLYLAAPGWRVFWSGHTFRGRDSSGAPLADVAPDEMELGGSRTWNGWTVESKLAHRNEKSDFGGSEFRPDRQPIPSALLWSASVERRFGEAWRLALAASNLLDDEYVRSADRKATQAPGRSVAVRFSWMGN